MRIDEFSTLTDLVSKTEIQKVEYLAFFLLENEELTEFNVNKIIETLIILGFAHPNSSRLKTAIKKSSAFNKGVKKEFFRISAKSLKALREKYPNITKSEDIVSDDSLLPEILLKETKRPYLLKLALQINAAYESNLFDACALMMRRLLEVLLIHCFEEKGIESKVQDLDGNYQNLKTLINKAISFPEISLSGDVKKDIDVFRELGNLSAHRVKYNCRRSDIKSIRMAFRAVIEELLYISNLLKK